ARARTAAARCPDRGGARLSRFRGNPRIGLLTTAGTPGEIIMRLNSELNRALRDPDLIARFAQQGLTPAGGQPAGFQAPIGTDLKNFIAIARAANIKAE